MTEERSAFDDLGRQFAWDQTSIKLAEECLYKYKLTMIDGWQSPHRSVHLLFGGWYATALEHFHKHVALGMEREDAVREVVREVLVSTWIDGSPWLSDHNTKTRENLIRTIVWYLDQFEDDACKTIILSDGKPAVEYTFALPVDNDIIFTGHIDRFVEYAGFPYAQDQKTSQNTITPKYFEGFNPDTQMSMYTFAGRIIYNAPVKGVIIDAAQIAVGFTRFERGFTFRTNAQLDEWYDHSMWHIEQARKATLENYFPMNRTSCGNYGGCPFRHACSRSPEVREQFLKADFVQGPKWNPLAVR